MTIRNHLAVWKYLAAQYLDDEAGALPGELQSWPEYGSIYDIDDDWVEDEPVPTAVVRTIKLMLVRECEELKAENARLRAAADAVLANAVAQGYDPDDCPDWFEGMISCDSLNALHRVRNREDSPA